MYNDSYFDDNYKNPLMEGYHSGDHPAAGALLHQLSHQLSHPVLRRLVSALVMLACDSLAAGLAEPGRQLSESLEDRASQWSVVQGAQGVHAAATRVGGQEGGIRVHGDHTYTLEFMHVRHLPAFPHGIPYHSPCNPSFLCWGGSTCQVVCPVHFHK